MADIFVAPAKEKQKTKAKIKDRSMPPLSSFYQNPTGVSFQTQKEKESIILFIRSHYITNLSWTLITLMLIVLPIIVLTIASNFGIDFLSTQTATRFTVVFILLYYLLISSYVFVSFLHWFYNVFIVTSERIVDIDYSDVVIHNMAETKLSHVEDVRCMQSGFIPSLFNYGNLFVQTAGTEENFEAISIPRPGDAIDIITQLTGKK